jgi:hypothetical protein
MLRLGLVMVLATSMAQPPEGIAETAGPLTITVECVANPECEFVGEDIELRIRLRNTSTSFIGLPADYLRKSGPHVQLTDVRNGANRWLRVGLPRRQLMDKFTYFGPNEVFELTTTLSHQEIRSFRHDFVDLEVEVAVGSKLKYADMEAVPFSESKIFSIAGRDTTELRKANQ